MGRSDTTYQDNIDNQENADGLTAKFNLFSRYFPEWQDKMDQKYDVDTPLKLVNQAAMGVWYAQLNTEKWRFMVILLFNVVNDLGRQLTEQGVFSLMNTGELANADTAA